MLVKDMIFGWVIRTEDRLVFFSECDNLQLKRLQGMFAGNAIYNDVCEDITKLIAANANEKKRAAVAASVEAEESPPQRNEFTGIRERVNTALAGHTARIDAMQDAMRDEESQRTRVNEIMGIKSDIDGQLDAGSIPAVLADEWRHVYAKVFQLTNS